jgi:hypothetical protein
MQGERHRIPGIGFRVQSSGLGVRVQGLGFRVLVSRGLRGYLSSIKETGNFGCFSVEGLQNGKEDSRASAVSATLLTRPGEGSRRPAL